MEKSEIVRKLMGMGILVSPTVADQLDERIFNSAPKNKLVLTDIGVSTTIEIPKKKEALGVEDITAFYREKYEGLRKMLLDKIEPVSIGNAGGFSEVSVIGMVSEITVQGFVLEDDSGKIEVVSKFRPDLKDVVGMKGHMREGKLVEREIVYPDIPLPKSKGPELTIILTPKPLDEKGIQIVFDEGESTGEVLFVPNTPAKLSVGGVNILVFRGDGKAEEWLRKRHLPEVVVSRKDHYLIDKVPHLFWQISDKNSARIYKGVAIVETDTKTLARINMGTGKVVFGEI